MVVLMTRSPKAYPMNSVIEANQEIDRGYSSMHNQDYYAAYGHFEKAYKKTDTHAIEHAQAAACMASVLLENKNPNLKKVETYLDEAYDLAKQNNYHNIAIACAFSFGTLHTKTKNYHLAQHYLEEAYTKLSLPQDQPVGNPGYLKQIYYYVASKVSPVAKFLSFFKMKSARDIVIARTNSMILASLSNVEILKQQDRNKAIDALERAFECQNSKQDTKKGLEFFKQAYNAAGITHHLERAQAADGIGCLYLTANEPNFQEVEKYLLESYQICTKHGNDQYKNQEIFKSVFFTTTANLGVLFLWQNDCQLAEKYLLEAYTIAQTEDEKAKIAGSLGTCYLNLKNLDTAEKYFNLALITQNIIIYKKALHELCAVGAYYQDDLKDHKKAYEIFISVYQKAGVTYEVERAHAASCLGGWHMDRLEPDFKKAEQYLEEAYTLCTKEENKKKVNDIIVATIMTNLGIIKIQKKDYTAAEQYLLDAYEVSKNHKNNAHIASNLGLYYLSLQQVEKAQKYLKIAAQISDQIIYQRVLYAIYSLKIFLLHQSNNLLTKAEKNFNLLSIDSLQEVIKNAQKFFDDAGDLNYDFKKESWHNQLAMITEDQDARLKAINIALVNRQNAHNIIPTTSQINPENKAQENKTSKELLVREDSQELLDFAQLNVLVDKEVEKINTLCQAYVKQPNKKDFEYIDYLLDELTCFICGTDYTNLLYPIHQIKQKLYSMRDQEQEEVAHKTYEQQLVSPSANKYKKIIYAHNKKDVIKFIEKLGFKEKRVSGSHFQYRHVDGRGTTIAVHRNELSPNCIRNLAEHIGYDVQKFYDDLLNV